MFGGGGFCGVIIRVIYASASKTPLNVSKSDVKSHTGSHFDAGAASAGSAGASDDF